MVEQGHPAGTTAVRTAERGHEHATRTAVQGVRSRIAGLVGEFVRLDGTDDLGSAWVGLGVEDVGP